MRKTATSSKGFTLIELLVAMTILALAASIGFATYSAAQIAGRDSRRKQDMNQLQAALVLYYQYQTPHAYPPTTTFANLSPLLVPNFINQMPADPGSTPYTYNGTVSTFSVCATLENSKDPDCTGPVSGTTCPFCRVNP